MTEVSSRERAEYARLLQQRRANNSQEPVANRFPWQGELAIRELLEAARAEQRSGRPAEIFILTGSAPDRVYETDEPAVWQQIVAEGGIIKILVWGSNPRRCGSVLRCLVDSRPSVEMRFSGTDVLSGQLPHFVLVDKQAYRLEAAHPQFPENTVFTETWPEIPARICFNDPDGGTQLANYFQDLWNLSRPIPREKQSAP
jgi:hypothetical protein